MSLERLAEWYAAITLLLVCVSHALHPKLWAQLFLDLFKLPYGGLAVGLFTLQTGLLILLVHNVWRWDLTVIVTVLGWGWTFKGALYLLIPTVPGRVSAGHLQHPRRFVYAGLTGIALATGVIVGIVRS